MQRSPRHSRTQRGAQCTALSRRRRPNPSRPASPRAGRESSGFARPPRRQTARPRPDPARPLDPGRPEWRPEVSAGADKMMLQHPGQVSASEVSASAIVPCLSPPGSLVFEDFANLTPFVKEELRFAIQNKHLCHRMSSALESVTVSGRPLEMAVMKTEVAPEEDERKKRRRERNKIAAAKCRNKKKEKTECLQKESEKLESVNAELKAQIEELKNEKQHLIYMLNLHRPTCIVRAQNGRTPEDERNLFIQQIKEGTLQS
ncbi:cyclic AMP-dependent transcription factor ATF-3 isoform X1 [Herpailurus yagouaroundi]|uniref:cyclic AMP-dependent transcription factor ATF-3 isoform X1 n=1 Tax=Herpailurus yagouaroundi TaxID=1608482 RepID=UPI001AD6545A|nr:cyclic AMP-dependent transcription factor ATF-3 isoform X1 [Puma yagouaroundi]